MDFNDTSEEAEFRAEARAFLNAHAQLKGESEPRDETEAAYLARAQAWQKLKYENGWACLNWPKEYGGRDATPMQADHLEPGRGALRRAGGSVCDRARHVRPDDDRVRRRAAEARAVAAYGVGRTHLVSALQRACGRLGPGGAADEGRTGRRRVGHQRPEDLDVRRALLRLGHSRHAHRTRLCRSTKA